MDLVDRCVDDVPDVIIAVTTFLEEKDSMSIHLLIFNTLPYVFFNLPITKLGKEK
jgi:hypothetical protein